MHDIEDNIYFSHPLPLWVWIVIAVATFLLLIIAIIIVKKLRAPKPMIPLTPFEASLQLLHATVQQSMIQPVAVSVHAVSTALRSYLAKSFSAEAETCTTSELHHIFVQNATLSPFTKNWLSLLNQCDDIRFGGNKISQNELAILINQAIAYLNEVNTAFNTQREKEENKE